MTYSILFWSCLSLFFIYSILFYFHFFSSFSISFEAPILSGSKARAVAYREAMIRVRVIRRACGCFVQSLSGLWPFSILFLIAIFDSLCLSFGRPWGWGKGKGRLFFNLNIVAGFLQLVLQSRWAGGCAAWCLYFVLVLCLALYTEPSQSPFLTIFLPFSFSNG